MKKIIFFVLFVTWTVSDTNAWFEPEFIPVWESKSRRISHFGSGENYTNSLGMNFVYIKPGTFMMGSPWYQLSRDGDEKKHKVTLSRGFYMQTTEVTQGQ